MVDFLFEKQLLSSNLPLKTPDGFELESFGISVNDEMYAQMERQMGNAVYFSIGGAAIGLPLLALVVAGVLWSVCYVILGAHAPFKAMFAVVAHAVARAVVVRSGAQGLPWRGQGRCGVSLRAAGDGERAGAAREGRCGGEAQAGAQAATEGARDELPEGNWVGKAIG